jgi:hypothetical protein
MAKKVCYSFVLVLVKGKVMAKGSVARCGRPGVCESWCVLGPYLTKLRLYLAAWKANVSRCGFKAKKSSLSGKYCWASKLRTVNNHVDESKQGKAH